MMGLDSRQEEFTRGVALTRRSPTVTQVTPELITQLMVQMEAPKAAKSRNRLGQKRPQRVAAVPSERKSVKWKI
jgi:hypothetical protein